MSDNNNHSNESAIKKITIIGLIFNLLLSAIKFVLGYFGKSQAVIADAIHSLSDMATDLAVIVGVKFWEPPPDDDHPYGHKRIETVVTLIIGFILGYVGIEIIINAVKTIPETHQDKATWLATLGPFLSIIIKEILYQKTVAVGKRVKSTAVIANAWHHRSDALSSIPAFISVLIAAIFPKFAFVDHIGAIIVAVFIFKVTYGILKPAFLELIDSGATKKEVNQIKNISLAVNGVISIHKIRTRRVGDGYFVDMHIQVDGNLSVLQGHSISGKVKNDIKENISNVIDIIVHIEPA